MAVGHHNISVSEVNVFENVDNRLKMALELLGEVEKDLGEMED